MRFSRFQLCNNHKQILWPHTRTRPLPLAFHICTLHCSPYFCYWRPNENHFFWTIWSPTNLLRTSSSQRTTMKPDINLKTATVPQLFYKEVRAAAHNHSSIYLSIYVYVYFSFSWFMNPFWSLTCRNSKVKRCARQNFAILMIYPSAVSCHV